ncbi:MAG: ABC transporter ATP-binding protein [Candidatus Paracaedimonas acanthamoebae]|uniref:ABC transporter ATP-binding protein n=1 Tax=Candidatus Paracaedimonas acanthamoebae TaxID=244581 RepID=A0A8J7PS54_9PROT|nr:ABC transporter ATP-binding protein [Candidatus Paracaedimonas acanthamoebae]
MSQDTILMPGTPDFAVRVAALSKLYKIYASPQDFLKEILTSKVYHDEFWALKEVSFTVKRGQVVGIIGRNGAGKSTLLKILAGTLEKTYGELEVNGKISALLELGTGFNPEYSGRQNIYLSGMYMGLSKQQIAQKEEWIINFSELKDIIDRPFKTYSSGMQSRLMFSCAVSIDPDIFIVDEALATGDGFFVNKCVRRMEEICASGSTVFLVTHGVSQVAQLCDTAIWLDNGEIKLIGDPLEVVREYDYAIHVALSGGTGRIEKLETPLPEQSEILPLPENAPAEIVVSPVTPLENNIIDTGATVVEGELTVFKRGPVYIDKVEFLDDNEIPIQVVRFWDTLKIRVWYSCEGEIPSESLGIAYGIERESDLALICQFNTVNVLRDEDLLTYHDQPYRKKGGRKGYIDVRLSPLQLVPGDYLVSVGLLANIPYTSDFYEYHHRLYKLVVIRNGFPAVGAFCPISEWNHQVLEE